MLRVALADDGYAVQVTPDAVTGLHLLRDSATPVTVLFDVLPMPNLSHEESGLALFDAFAQDERLARNGYVLMSTDPAQALAGVETLPAGLRILPKPFRLEELFASLEQVDEWLCTHTIPQAFAKATGLNHAQLSVETSRRLLGEARDRLQRRTDHPARSDDTDPNR
jgi:DNA-binding response OmpR family regulator